MPAAAIQRADAVPRISGGMSGRAERSRAPHVGFWLRARSTGPAGGGGGAGCAPNVVSPTANMNVPSTGWPSADTTRHSTWYLPRARANPLARSPRGRRAGRRPARNTDRCAGAGYERDPREPAFDWLAVDEPDAGRSCRRGGCLPPAPRKRASRAPRTPGISAVGGASRSKRVPGACAARIYRDVCWEPFTPKDARDPPPYQG